MKSFNIFPVVKIRDLKKRHLDKDEDIYKHEIFENPILYKRGKELMLLYSYGNC